MSQNGRVELEFSGDRTQVFATVYPPQAGGEAITPRDILDQLRALGVMYGICENEVIKAARSGQDAKAPAVKVLVAQGVLPENGANAQILWKVDTEIVSQPMALRPDGLPDYFALDTRRKVKAGQLLASILPAHSGTPGTTLTAPLQTVPPHFGKDFPLTAGPGVRVSDDRLQFFAAVDGFAEHYRDRISVLALHQVEGSLETDAHVFTGGVVILGDLKGGSVKADGIVAVRGTIIGATIRAHGDVYVGRAAGSKIITEGNVFVLNALRRCEISTRKKVVALDGAGIVGGSLVAGEGVEAANLGAPDFTETRICVGVDELSNYRLQEVEEEIAACELNVQKIGQALRPLTSLTTEKLPPEKRQLVETLLEQRRRLEARVGELYNEKRLLMLNAKTRFEGAVIVSKTVHPGVYIAIHHAQTLVESPLESVRFVEDENGKSIRCEPFQQAKAA